MRRDLTDSKFPLESIGFLVKQVSKKYEAVEIEYDLPENILIQPSQDKFNILLDLHCLNAGNDFDQLGVRSRKAYRVRVALHPPPGWNSNSKCSLVKGTSPGIQTVRIPLSW